MQSVKFSFQEREDGPVHTFEMNYLGREFPVSIKMPTNEVPTEITWMGKKHNMNLPINQSFCMEQQDLATLGYMLIALASEHDHQEAMKALQKQGLKINQDATVLIVGNVVDGVEIVGPFYCTEDWTECAERNYNDHPWVVAPMYTPPVE